MDPKLASEGIKVKIASFSVPEVTKRRGSEFQKHINEIINGFDFDELLNSPILTAYKKFHQEAGLPDAMTPAEYLLKLIQKSGMLPNINKVVDCYNIVSAETLLSIGAHDLAHIKGDLCFKYTDGTERYTPLFKDSPEKVSAGEYACMDDEKIICRMDVKQCDETKVGPDTRNFIIYVQGNSETDEEYVLNGSQKVCDNIVKYCNGEYVFL
ncbi:MAG: phenylalanine--tRNA ligase beta subunit-related protein [Patescibacteria group bacterium]|nr:hypothetical protein [Patescibacteria group bacterium]